MYIQGKSEETEICFKKSASQKVQINIMHLSQVVAEKIKAILPTQILILLSGKIKTILAFSIYYMPHCQQIFGIGHCRELPVVFEPGYGISYKHSNIFFESGSNTFSVYLRRSMTKKIAEKSILSLPDTA